MPLSLRLPNSRMPMHCWMLAVKGMLMLELSQSNRRLSSACKTMQVAAGSTCSLGAHTI